MVNIVQVQVIPCRLTMGMYYNDVSQQRPMQMKFCTCFPLCVFHLTFSLICKWKIYLKCMSFTRSTFIQGCLKCRINLYLNLQWFQIYLNIISTKQNSFTFCYHFFFFNEQHSVHSTNTQNRNRDGKQHIAQCSLVVFECRTC